MPTEPINVPSDPPAFTPADPASPPPDPGAYAPAAPTPLNRPYRKIRRDRDDRVIAGVAGGLGRYVNVDPVIFRILFVALTLFGGSGILLYLFGWIAVPEDGRDDAPINRLFKPLPTPSLTGKHTLPASRYSVIGCGRSSRSPFVQLVTI